MVMSRAVALQRNHISIVPTPSIDPPANTGQLCFDRFVLTPRERRLTKDGVPIEIGGRSFDLLLALVEQAGLVIPKRELLQRVWSDVVVEDAALRFHMTRLRKLLGDGRGDTRLITTQVGVGYAFVGVVRRAEAALLAPAFTRPPSNPRLPGRLDRVIGRDDDLAALVERLSATRLLTIAGAAGVGKTSLAIELAHDLETSFADGADFVDLAAVPLADCLAPAIARALGVEIGVEGPRMAVLGHLSGRRQLLVLDNCEHLLDAVADLIEQIALAAPGVRIVVTSRQALRARNEHVHRLSPHHAPADWAPLDREALLACPAIELFLHHADTAGGGLGQDVETLRAIAQLSGRLGGVALAIELAAIRAATYGVDATSRMLGDHLSLLWPGRRTASPRQRTLKATFDWSYDLLSNPERHAFERLSKLASPFSYKTGLEAIADDTHDTSVAAAALDELAEKSLILPSNGQYQWSEMTRIYARARFDARLYDDNQTAPSPSRAARQAI